jgi:hypothetical protein
MPYTPRLSHQDFSTLEARRDQLESDLCQLHLDELGATQMGDDAGAAEAAALMRTVEAELAELAAAIAEREAELARVRADFGPFSLPHPPINDVHERASTVEQPEEPEEEPEPPAVQSPSAVDAAWLDYCSAALARDRLPHNAPAWERRHAEKQVQRATETLRRAEEREQERGNH